MDADQAAPGQAAIGRGDLQIVHGLGHCRHDQVAPGAAPVMQGQESPGQHIPAINRTACTFRFNFVVFKVLAALPALDLRIVELELHRL